MNTYDPRWNVFGKSLVLCVCLVLAGATTSGCGTGVKKAAGTQEVQGHLRSYSPHRISVEKRAVVARTYGRLPLYFMANKGQVNGKVAFYETGSGHTTFFTRKGIVLGLEKREAKAHPIRHDAPKPRVLPSKSLARRAADVRTSYLRISMPGMNKDVQIVPEGLQQGKVNYFIGNDPHKWRANIPTYKAVLYKNAYPGIDIKFYGNNRRLEYDIIVKPGADPSTVRVRYSGAKDVRVTQNGDLAIDLAGGRIIEQKPVVYQQLDGKRVMRHGAFIVRKDRQGSQVPKTPADAPANLRTFTSSFALGPYDRDAPLIVDPTLVYSTYLGSNIDYSYAIVVDPSGNAYVTGYTDSPDFPVTQGAFQSTPKGEVNGFITEIAAGGESLVYSTYSGGSGSTGRGDYATSIAVDSAGNAYVTGYTNSADFPVTQGAFQTTLKGHRNVFITEIASS